jgi:hypothetical protein
MMNLCYIIYVLKLNKIVCIYVYHALILFTL